MARNAEEIEYLSRMLLDTASVGSRTSHWIRGSQSILDASVYFRVR